MKCLCCASEDLKGHVVLEFYMPLSKRGGGIKIGGTKFSNLDIRAAWENNALRSIRCFTCGTGHFYDVSKDELSIDEEGITPEPQLIGVGIHG